MGKIIVMKPMQSTGLIEFKLYDGTGTFLIHHYLNEEDELVRPLHPHVPSRARRGLAYNPTYIEGQASYALALCEMH